MNSPVLTFFNNKGGVGKTSLIYHLAWMFAGMRKRVVIADFDPQANLTAAFMEEEVIEQLWNSQEQCATIHQCVKPLAGVGDIAEPVLQNIATDLYLIPGDVNLSGYEDTLSAEWPNSMGDNNLYRPMRILSSFWQVMQMASAKVQADIVLVDIGPNLGAINRSVLIATDYPQVYREAVLDEQSTSNIKQVEDPYCLATIKHYRSLIPMAQEHRKPIFNLTSADGAIGSHANAVQDAKSDFKKLAEKIAGHIGMMLEF